MSDVIEGSGVPDVGPHQDLEESSSSYDLRYRNVSSMEHQERLSEDFENTTAAIGPAEPVSNMSSSNWPPAPDSASKHSRARSILSNSSSRSYEPRFYGAEDAARMSFTGTRSSIASQRPISIITDESGEKSPQYFHSRRIEKGTTPRPWLDGKKDPRQKWVWIIPLIGLILGIVLGGIIVWQAEDRAENLAYCPVYSDDFSSWNSKVWTKEVEVGGYGNGQFEETTDSDENVFLQNGMLVIKPTLQDSKLMEHNNVLNLTALSTCTSDLWSNCVTSTNTTNGTVINPVKSGRINTKAGATIKYGRVEVEAKLPAGDWMWPAIWMLPVKNTYGPWPASGEIDILESRGNNYTYPMGGDNIMSSTLHWGPDSTDDRWYTTNDVEEALHTTWASEFHTYGLEWSEDYIFSYIDTRLLQVLYTKFEKPFWQRGKFPPATDNNTALIDPWSQTGSATTPFDQDFYLILNVAVGGTNGWFQDGMAAKPWVDAAPTAKRDFWNARSQWYPTWQEGGQMEVKSVKMWQQQGYNGCQNGVKRDATVTKEDWKKVYGVRHAYKQHKILPRWLGRMRTLF